MVGRKLAPQQLDQGNFATPAKSELTTSGSDLAYTVNDTSKVVCGNVPTANATVYIVDTVLMPPQWRHRVTTDRPGAASPPRPVSAVPDRSEHFGAARTRPCHSAETGSP